MWLEVTNTNLLNHPECGHVSAETIDISEEMSAAETRVMERLSVHHRPSGPRRRGESGAS